MKKATVLFLLATYLFSKTELSQLLKFPAFLSHFIEHKEQDKNLSLWQFLDIHYSHGNVKDADHEKDMKLPFKTHDNCTVQLSDVVPTGILCIGNKYTYINAEKNIHIHNNDSVISSFLSSIWQPPKSC